MMTLASTAIPIVRIKPAIPGRVSVAPRSASAAQRTATFIKRARSAITPESL